MSSTVLGSPATLARGGELPVRSKLLRFHLFLSLIAFSWPVAVQAAQATWTTPGVINAPGLNGTLSGGGGLAFASRLERAGLHDCIGSQS
jgi:hypothetical protein